VLDIFGAGPPSPAKGHVAFAPRPRSSAFKASSFREATPPTLVKASHEQKPKLCPGPPLSVAALPRRRTF
jgi:hypothetical protein